VLDVEIVVVQLLLLRAMMRCDVEIQRVNEVFYILKRAYKYSIFNFPFIIDVDIVVVNVVGHRQQFGNGNCPLTKIETSTTAASNVSEFNIVLYIFRLLGPTTIIFGRRHRLRFSDATHRPIFVWYRQFACPYFQSVD
jgi:hypothetical protein